MNNNIYIERGYADRNEYLASLADEYGIHIFVVRAVANVLGQNEDFDGLVNALEEYSEW